MSAMRSLFPLLLAALACGRIGYDDVVLGGQDALGGVGQGGASGGAAGQGGVSGTAGQGGSGAVGPPSDGSAPDGPLPGAGAPSDASGSQGGAAGSSVPPTDAQAPPPDVADTSNPSGDPAGSPVSVNNLFPTAEAGSVTSGTEYLDTCPPGQAIIGYHGTESRSPSMPWLQGIQTQCGQLQVGPAPGYAITTSIGMLFPIRGIGSGNAWMALCPPDQVVVGFEGRTSDWVAQLAFRCAPLSVTSGPGGYAVTVGGPITTTVSAGSNAGTAFSPIDCPAGRIAGATSLRTDNYPRTFALQCGVPVLAP